jgi:hypothetical protein
MCVGEIINLHWRLAFIKKLPRSFNETVLLFWFERDSCHQAIKEVLLDLWKHVPILSTHIFFY